MKGTTQIYEVDFIEVGQAGRHGDAIALRFTRPDNGYLAHVIIDAGFETNGWDLVEHFRRWYDTNSVDLAILTHPDGDHIGGMGVVVRQLDVEYLWLHDLGAHGGGGLPAAEAVDDLIATALGEGTTVQEPFAGANAFGGLTILGPTEPYYNQLVQAQHEEAGARAAGQRGRTLAEAAPIRGLARLPDEVPFGDAGGTSSRNNSSMVTLLEVGGRRMLFTSDAGVPALDAAWDWLAVYNGDVRNPDFAQMPHHGSRHNASSALLNRILGPIGGVAGRTAFVNVGPHAVKHPSPRVANAFARRGFRVYLTKGQPICDASQDAPPRGWQPLRPLGPLDESNEED